MGVYWCLCVSRSIDSASVPQQACDPDVMLLIATPVQVESKRACETMGMGGGGWGGGARGRDEVAEAKKDKAKDMQGNKKNN